MGKIKAKELVGLHAKYISIVTQGANGEEFASIKCAAVPGELPSGERTEKGQETEGDERGFLMRLLEKITPKRSEEDQAMSEELKAMLTELTGAVQKLDARIDALSNKAADDQPEHPETGDEKTEPEKGDKPEEPAKGAETPETTDNSEVVKMVKGIAEQVTALTGRIDEFEKGRAASNALPDNEATEKSDGNDEASESVFKGVFIRPPAVNE